MGDFTFCELYNTSKVHPAYFHAARETASNGDGSRKDNKDNGRRNPLISAVFRSLNRARVVLLPAYQITLGTFFQPDLFSAYLTCSHKTGHN